VRRVYRLMLSPEYGGNLGGQTAKYHAFCIHNIPIPLERFAFCHIGFHGVLLNENIRMSMWLVTLVRLASGAVAA
jgi:hypothetical protein